MDQVTTAGREKIEALEDQVKKLPQRVIKIRHFFAKGVYGREMTLEKGDVFVGRTHTQSQINICSKGDVTIATENGTVRVKAPFTMVAPAGTKRAGFAHEDTVWTTILGTELTDPDVINDTLTTATFEEYLQICRQQLAIEGEK